MSLNPNNGMSYEDYNHKVAVAVHERTGWPLEEAERFTGDVSDMMNAAYSVQDAAEELLQEAQQQR